jgi:hypothetical protein
LKAYFDKKARVSTESASVHPFAPRMLLRDAPKEFAALAVPGTPEGALR